MPTPPQDRISVHADGVDALYRLPPEDFVAARTALVKTLRAAGRRADAAEIAGFRRPSVADWALNMAAVEDPRSVARFLDVAAAMRQAQADALEGRRGVELRAALGELRDATEHLLRQAVDRLDQAGRAAAAQVGALTGRLNELATNPALGEQLRGGKLGAGEVPPVDLFAGLGGLGGLEPAAPGGTAVTARGRRPSPGAGPAQPGAARSRAAGDRAAGGRAARTRAAGARGERDDEGARRRAVRRRELEAALAQAEGARREAEARLGEAAARVEAATTAVAEAEARLEAARAELHAAGEEHATLVRRAAEAARVAQQRRRELEASGRLAPTN